MDILSRLGKRMLVSRLAALRDGHVTIEDAAGITSWGNPAHRSIEIRVRDDRFYSSIAFGGSVGAGESFADGWWDCSDLTGLVRLMLRNRSVLDDIDSGWARVTVPARRVLHALRRNTRGNSRRNIAAHYDLSNEFFAQILDPSMTYSCGIFSRGDSSLHDASMEKYRRIGALLDLRASDRVIEIGTGWGGFAMYAAATYGCHVTTTTISDAQYALAARRIAEAGLADRITLLRQDYRDLRGSFDKLVSIEMIEAVGHEHYDTFFRQCSALLKADGRAVIQAITIRDEQYESARREVDFIKRHIFPGCCIPSLEVLTAAASSNALKLSRADEIGLHYALTLSAWRNNLFANRARVGALGFDERFLRLWEFYFCYCEGGFMEGALGTAQMVFRPAAAPDISPVIAPEVPSAPWVAA